MRGFELVHPASRADAIRMLGEDEDSRAFAGGTALMLMLKSGLYNPRRLIVLGGVMDASAAIAATADGGLRIGAMATLTDVEHNADIMRVAPVLSRAMRRLANVRVRNVARVGGALAHGDPHMDLPPVLAALGGEASLVGPGGERHVAVEALYTGYYETVLTRGELIVSVAVPSQIGWRSAYIKCTTRAADDWPALGVAVSLKITNGVVEDARLLISAATEKLTRLHEAERQLRGKAPTAVEFARVAEAAAAEAPTIDDASGSAAYKSALLRVHMRRALAEAAGQGVAP